MTTILSANGLLEIPEVFRKADDLKPGQRCDIERVGHGDYRVRVEHKPEADAPDLVAWLFSCPEKDWWTEPEGRSKSTLKPSHQFEE
jgi:hypothetical protein